MRLATIGLCWLAAVAALSGQGAPAGDEAAVRALVQRYVDARGEERATAIGALFTADADQYTTGGEWRRGRAAVVAGTLEASRRNPGERSIVVEAVRFVTPDVAIADGPYTIGARRIWTTFVAVRESGEWRIAAIRNSAPAAQARP